MKSKPLECTNTLSSYEMKQRWMSGVRVGTEELRSVVSLLWQVLL